MMKYASLWPAQPRNTISTRRTASLVLPFAFAAACSSASSSSTSSTPDAASGGASTTMTTSNTATTSNGGGTTTSTSSVEPSALSSASGGGAAESTSVSASSTGASASSGAGGGGTPGVRLIGRFDESTPDKPQFEWTGSAIEARFEGTSVSVTIGGSANYFTAVVDGANEMTFATTGQLGDYPIATRLAAGTHTVLLYRLNEASGNANSFEGFDFGGGQLLAPQAPPPHAIEMVGDSITAGYGNECMTGGTGYPRQGEWISHLWRDHGAGSRRGRDDNRLVGEGRSRELRRLDDRHHAGALAANTPHRRDEHVDLLAMDAQCRGHQSRHQRFQRQCRVRGLSELVSVARPASSRQVSEREHLLRARADAQRSEPQHRSHRDRQRYRLHEDERVHSKSSSWSFQPRTVRSAMAAIITRTSRRTSRWRSPVLEQAIHEALGW